MFNASRVEKDGAVEIRLSGTLNEQSDIAAVIGPLPPRSLIVCRDLVSINSMGVRTWIEFFAAEAKRGAEFAFAECPPPIVEQLNYITNFSCGAPVESVSVPFTCEGCRKETRGTIRTDELRKVAYRVPPIRCPRCQGRAKFDDLPEEYFAFLIRRERA